MYGSFEIERGISVETNQVKNEDVEATAFWHSADLPLAERNDAYFPLMALRGLPDRCLECSQLDYERTDNGFGFDQIGSL